MKDHFLLTVMQNSARRISTGLGITFALACLLPNASAQEVNLGTANNFAVLAGSAVPNTGLTVINGGNVGVSPGSSVTGFPPGIVNAPYSIHLGDSVALDAQNALTSAFNTAAGLPVTQSLTGQNLGGLMLTPGVYSFASTAQLTGTLTLNDMGNPDAVFVFQIGTALTTASDSSVETINDPAAGAIPGISVFWQIGSSATLGAGTDFEGNILAKDSITAASGASVDGRLLAETGSVTLNDNLLTVPPAETVGGGSGVPDNGSTLLLLASALATLFAFGRRFSVWSC